MKYFLISILVLFELGRLSAQSFVGKLNPYPATVERTMLADDTLKILAIMVNFQEDADGTTFGNGKFGTIYSQNYGNDILDPLPHDKKYFESHLLFVKNYFSKVSKDNLEIEYTVLPDTFSVSDRMRNYSPDPGSDDFTPIADFSVEAWTKADELNPGFPFIDYNVFLIFHAGVGRDISLPGSIGNERDLPSVYLSDKAFKEIFGETYEGIPVSGGSFKITNNMIIPETESRELETISGKFLFEITINGLICASIGSHLGLPDLFDTETGLSAIGRFGLMDGQSIFAYLGVYPPEPSPWEKIKLGWAEPVTMEIQNADVSIVTNIAATMSDTVILKVPLNSSEYYLIENRIRDANKDGSTISYVAGVVARTKTFLNDTTGYRSFDVDSLSGVIFDVDEFDWAVPGNGIVIWHIDENVINEKIAENKVNTDKNRRGVDVEEADGVQDIGEIFYTIFGDQVIGEGTEEDFWHKNNPATLFENRFAKDTRPNTLTNSGANSLITVKNFSEIDNRMNFRVEFGDSVIKPFFVSNYTIPNPEYLSTFNYKQKMYFISAENSEGQNRTFILTKDSILTELNNFAWDKPAVIIKDDVLHIYGEFLSNLNFWITDGISTFIGSVNIPDGISTPIAINHFSPEEHEICFGTTNGKIVRYDLAQLPNTFPTKKEETILKSDYEILKIAVHEQIYAAIGWKYQQHPKLPILFTSEGNVELDDSLGAQFLVLTKDSDGKYLVVITENRNKIKIIKTGKVISEFLNLENKNFFSFSISDLKKDGSNYIIVGDENSLNVFNQAGSLAENFPFYEIEIAPYKYILSGDIGGDSFQEILVFDDKGNLFAINGGNGELIDGFPFSVGEYAYYNSILVSDDKIIFVSLLPEHYLSSGYFVKGWILSPIDGKIFWKEKFANNQNNLFVPAAENTNRINEFFPSSRAYNYPNPVYEGTTNIRYYVDKDAHINIKIFDLAGDFVVELNDDAQGGMDNETVWNVGDIQSGVYLARIEANSTSGKTEQAVIKIAVVK